MLNDPVDQSPCEVLRAEHQDILRVISVLERLVDRSRGGAGFEAEAFQRCVEFFRLFADACHHAKEEDLLFPALESRGVPNQGGPIGVMLYEHRLARGFTADMAEALAAVERGDADGRQQFHAAAKQYIELLTNHIFKEDNVLFRIGDQVLTSQDQAALGGKFCETNCRGFGGKKREELRGIADELERAWPA